MSMDISEIRTKYNNGDYTYKAAIPKKVCDDHVFDEELSVKRNRELIKEHNENVDRLKRYARSQQEELNKRLTYDVVAYIMDYYNMTEKQAKLVESFTYQEYHSCMSDYFSYIDTFADFAFQLLPVNSTYDA